MGPDHSVRIVNRAVVRGGAEPAQADLWQVEPATAQGPMDRRGLWLSVPDRAAVEPQLTAEVELDAQEISVVELRLRNASRASSQLLWAGAGQEFTAGRRIALAEAEPDGDQRSIRVLRFRVGDHPEWRGTIRRLRVSLTPTAKPSAIAFSTRTAISA